MTKIEDIERAVAALAPEEFIRFRAWFEGYEAARFDAKVERDVATGKLDDLAEEALSDLRDGRAGRM